MNSMNSSTFRISHALTLLLVVPIAACGSDSTVNAPDVQRPRAARSMSDDYSAWSAPVHLDAPVNSSFIENSAELSKDELSLYFGSNRPGGEGSQDIWVARRASEDDPWGVPVNVGPNVNTPLVESGAHLSRDGHLLFFTSTRVDPTAQGSNDIWVSWRAHTGDDLGWEPAVNLGPGVNSPIFEAGPTTWGPEIYFARGPGVGVNGAPSDIWMSRREGNAYGPATLVEELSMPAPFHENRPTIRFDGREIILSSDRPGSILISGTTTGSQDLWASTRSGNGQPWALPVNLGPVVNTAFRETTASLSEDGTMLFFASDRPGGLGNLDLYVSTRGKGGTP
jgi:hypothetical protein